ncbi:M56 family metallopeptidase [Arthrobacter crystallopoietes]|uniref:Zn-dependent protease with chaperone function n=1 Tax=Crystallibacter crystallopoietes TaxID=37928 RepID=A0A1H1GVX7_9MICC|nr:M56 family metallopeptidase [Arthrobacter crystallopoietes]AUI52319.1 peptidase M48 [Arthrobacter crystallopoietes]SDR17385.1 Zn-dependent protease with chaperone function [Arthrobacter crystallopoietes]
MFWASYLLAAMAVILAWPVPVLLARAKWTARAPVTALVLWQAIALAGGLSMIGAMLTWGLEPLGENLLAGLQGLADLLVSYTPAPGLDLIHVFALSAALLLGVHLVFTLLLTYYRIRKQRNKHRDLLNLLSSPVKNSPKTLVISHPAPVAYCLPGGGGSVTVLSEGLLELLRPEELEAVLNHERAHLNQRHDLLLWAFAAWRSALPWLPTSQLAQRAVNELIEMLADDGALRTANRETLIRAVAVVASGERPSGVGAPAKELLTPEESEALSTAHRLHRLLSPSPPLGKPAQALVLACSALLLAVPTVLLLAPGLAG